MPPEKCENWIFRSGRSSSSPLLISRTVAVISENSQPSMRPRSSAFMCFQRITRGERMDEDIEAEFGDRLPERPQRVGVERLALQSRRR